MNYFKQIYYEMKHRRMMTWVSVSGTALAIFLVMLNVMTNRVYDVEVAPESHRGRILYGQGMHICEGEGMDGSTNGLSYNLARNLYENLDGVERVAYFDYQSGEMTDVAVKNHDAVNMIRTIADAGIWKIYDYTFIDGRPFNESEAESGARVAVISRSAARKLFGDDNVAGREIEIGAYPYRVVGVIENPQIVMAKSYAEVLVPYNPKNASKDDSFSDEHFGTVNALLLMKPGADPTALKKQVEQRYASLQAQLTKEGKTVVYHEQPYTSHEVYAYSFGSNNGPESEEKAMIDWAIYALLIILPAINLSSMTRSRLRHRVSEIGVRRAFGATRLSIIRDILCENFIITVIGGVIGLVLSILFIVFFSHYLVSYSQQLDGSSLEVLNARPGLNMLFEWSNFLWAFFFCFILNLLSATVPAWKASREQPAEAIASK